jgi:hypothetical protein
VAPVESSTPSSPDINVKVRAEHDPRSSFLTIRAIATPGARNRRKFSPQTLFYSSPPPLMPYEAGKKGATENLKDLYIPRPRGSSARRVRRAVARNGACTAVVRKYSCGSPIFGSTVAAGIANMASRRLRSRGSKGFQQANTRFSQRVRAERIEYPRDHQSGPAQIESRIGSKAFSYSASEHQEKRRVR